MRLITTLSCLVFFAVVVGLTPRPLFKPDWRTPYEQAVSEEDCEAIERIVDTLIITGLIVEGHQRAYDLANAGKCKYVDYDAEQLENAKFYADGNMGPLELPAWRVLFNSSMIGREVIYRDRKKFDANDRVKAAERRLYSIISECRHAFPVETGGVPDYSLLAYVLRNENISVESIEEISFAQKEACAYAMLGQVRVGNAAVETAEDAAALVWPSSRGSFLAKEAGVPSAYSEYRLLPLKKADEAFDLNGFVTVEDGVWDNPEPVYCDEPLLVDAEIQWTMYCVAVAALEQQWNPYAPLYAVYYSRRAKRLGWRNVEAAELAAKEALPEACYEAIVALEMQSAGDELHPKDYKSLEELPWPDKAGDVCGPEALGVKVNESE